MFCRYCGARLDDAAQFCTTCGKQTAKAPTPPGAAPQPVAQRPAPAPQGFAPVAQQPVPAPQGFAPVAQQPVPAPQGFAPAAPVPRRRGRKKAVVASLVALALLAGAGFAAWKLFFAPYDIDDKTFPDAAMRTYVASHVDADHDGKVSRDEAAAVEDLDVKGCAEVRGLGLFPNLHRLWLRGEALTSVDLKDVPSLQELWLFDGPPLSKLDLGDKPHLWKLEIPSTKLTEIDLSKAPILEYLELRGVPLAALDVSANPALKTFVCDDEVEVTGLENTSLKTYWAPSGFERTVAGDGQRTDDSTTTVEVRYNERNLVARCEIARGKTAPYSVWYTYNVGDDESRLPCACNIGGAGADRTHSLGYNDKGCLEGVWAGDRRIATFAYDDAGLLASVEAKPYDENSTALSLAYSYDADGRLESLGRNQESLTFAYNEEGLVSKVENSDPRAFDGTYAFDYDDSGRCVAMSMESSNGSYDEAYAYDDAGRVVSASRSSRAGGNGFGMAYPSMDATFEYDENGNLKSCTSVRDDGRTDQYTVSYRRLFGLEEYAPSGFQPVRLESPLQPVVLDTPWMPSAQHWSLLVGLHDPVAASLA